MRFFDRVEEQSVLEENRAISEKMGSQMTVVTGRRRIGKTKLILQACDGHKVLYWFISRANEGMLAAECAAKARQALGIFIPESVRSFADVFELVLQAGKSQHFTLVIDECQEFMYVNPAIFSRMQDIWDRLKDETHVHHVVSGSVFTMMKKIFQDAKEPLYGRASRIMQVKPFRTSVLKEILQTYHPTYNNEDLLALFAFTGGVPKYIELFMDAGCTTPQRMIEFMTRPGSMFLDEGMNLLIQEFGKDYGTYFSILAALAAGRTSMAQISTLLDGASIGGQLKKLEEDYELIAKKRPIFAKPNSQTVRFAIKDSFLKFWFRFMYRNRSFIAMDRPQDIAPIIEKEYPTYSGLVLEDYFRAKLRESGPYREVSSWWQVKQGEPQAEIDIVAIGQEDRTAFVAEVKRQRKQFREHEFLDKVALLKTKELQGYRLDPAPTCLTLQDM